MNTNRLNRSDWIFIVICCAILIGGFLFSRAFFRDAFPEASIDFKYDRDGSQALAQTVLTDHQVTVPPGYIHGSAFDYNGWSKTYLEKELGNTKAQAYYGKPISIWYWWHRWFKPSTKEEFSVHISPDGRMVGFFHAIPEEASGPSPTEAEAIQVANEYIYKTRALDSTRVKFFETSKLGRPNRTDWDFTYRDSSIQPVSGSDYRYYVRVQCGKISQYREELFVPEAWSAKYTKMRSYNNAAGSVDGIGMILTALAIGIILIIRIRKKDIQWRTAVWFGIVATILAFLNSMNNLTAGFVYYNTTDPWSGFLIKTIGGNIFMALMAGVGILLLTASAETMYRERYPNAMALGRMFSVRALRTKSTFKSILLGISMTAFFFSYQIAYYLIAGKFGAWSPADVPYDDLLKTSFPWAAVLMMGFFPAVSEEFMSRMFSIPFLQKLFKGRFNWLAIFIPAIIWGFGHAAYPNEPWWIRGVEVGIGGIIVGIIMLRFGILACLVWHYSVDALYTAFLMLRSQNLYFQLTGGIAAGLLIIPLLIAIIAYIRRHSFEPELGLANADVGSTALAPDLPPEPDEPVTGSSEASAATSESAFISEPAIETLPSSHGRGWALVVILLIVGIAGSLLPIDQFRSYITYKASKATMLKNFADTLRSSGWANPDTLTMYVPVQQNDNSTDPDFNAYLLKHSRSIKEANNLLQTRFREPSVIVNAYKPESRLKYWGRASIATGNILSLGLIPPEEMPGDSLSRDSAQAMIEVLMRARGMDLSQWEVKEYNQEKKPKRIDHYITYEAKDGDSRHFFDAKYRVTGVVTGNKIQFGPNYYFKVPEKWIRDHHATTPSRAIYRTINILAIATIVFGLIVTIFLIARKGLIPWKKALMWSIVPGILILISNYNTFVTMRDMHFDNPEIPLQVFRVTQFVTWVISGISIWVGVWLVFGVLLGLFPNAFESLRKPKLKINFQSILIAVAAVIGGRLLLGVISSLLASVSTKFLPPQQLLSNEFMFAPVQAFQLISELIGMSISIFALGAFILYIWSQKWQKPLQRLLLGAILVIAFMPGQAIYPGEWLYGFINAIATVGVMYLVLKFIIDPHPMVYLITGMTVILARLTMYCVEAGYQPLIWQVAIFDAIIIVVLLIWIGKINRKAIHA